MVVIRRAFAGAAAYAILFIVMFIIPAWIRSL